MCKNGLLFDTKRCLLFLIKSNTLLQIQCALYRYLSRINHMSSCMQNYWNLNSVVRICMKVCNKYKSFGVEKTLTRRSFFVQFYKHVQIKTKY